MPRHIDPAIAAHRDNVEKYEYAVLDLSGGSVENNSTMYVLTGSAHAHQVQKAFDAAVEEMDVECDVQVNLVTKRSGEYMGYAFVDVTNPLVCDAIVNGDVALQPIDYDETQQAHAGVPSTDLVPNRAFVYLNDDESLDGTKLFVTNVPKNDPGFLNAIFARYARMAPDVSVRISTARNNKSFAIVTYRDESDAAFALVMLRKIHAEYKGVPITMTCRYSRVAKRRQRS